MTDDDDDTTNEQWTLARYRRTIDTKNHWTLLIMPNIIDCISTVFD